MWTDISQFDIPDNLKTAAYGAKRDGKYSEIGEVCVVNSMFGKAKVRAIHPRKKYVLIWPLVLLATTGVVLAIWVENDIPSTPEPMRITVRSVANEGEVLTSTQAAQTVPTQVKKSEAPTIPSKVQTTIGSTVNASMAEKTVLAKPTLPPAKVDQTKTAPVVQSSIPSKSQTKPIASDNPLPKNPEVMPQVLDSPTAMQSSAMPLADKVLEPVIKKEKPSIPLEAVSLPELGTKILVPASSGVAPVQSGTQP